MKDSQSKPTRRGLLLGVAATGAAAAAVATLPGVQPQPAPQTELKPPPERGGGYQLTEHVKRYYKTTLI
jgi:hypothetical protein